MSQYLRAGWSHTIVRGTPEQRWRSGVAIAWPRYPRGGYSAVFRWHRWHVGALTVTWPNATKIGGLFITRRVLSLGWCSLELTTRWFLRDAI